MSIIAELPEGRFETFDDNETALVSTNEDPPKHRIGVLEENLGEGNLGAVSFNTVRPNGEHDEWATVGARISQLSNGMKFCMVTVSVRDETNQNTQEVAVFSPYNVVFNVPVSAPNLATNNNVGRELRSNNGRFWAVLQDDGNFVLYQNETPYIYTAANPYFATNTGGR